MRVGFIGCVHFSRRMLEALLRLDQATVCGVVTRSKSRFNADFESLAPLAEQHGIPFFMARKNDQEPLEGWIRERRPDILFCFGWSYLLRKPVLEVAPMGVVGFHPAALPANRGRHPLIWALALGLSETATTFFFMDEGADSGPILDQQPLPIDETDDAGTLYEKQCLQAERQLERFVPKLAAGDYELRPQQHGAANWWRKRSKKDGEIDWRMHAIGIHNLVRALAHPYPGAHCFHQDREIKIWRTEPVESEAVNAEPGRVLAVEEGTIIVKCDRSALRVLEHEFAPLPTPGDTL
jgi:methionyl-tRNA formyltransferase